MRILKIICLTLFGVVAIRTGVQANGAGTLWDGVYAEAQADRGAAIYKEKCEICHAANMRGGPGARGVVGLAFQFLWKDRTLGQLFEAMRTKMPPGQPGTLSDQEYVDVLAVILRGNGLPAGEGQELPADRARLDQLVITWEQP